MRGAQSPSSTATPQRNGSRSGSTEDLIYLQVRCLPEEEFNVGVGDNVTINYHDSSVKFAVTEVCILDFHLHAALLILFVLLFRDRFWAAIVSS